jgi:hypothetical protein
MQEELAECWHRLYPRIAAVQGPAAGITAHRAYLDRLARLDRLDPRRFERVVLGADPTAASGTLRAVSLDLYRRQKSALAETFASADQAYRSRPDPLRAADLLDACRDLATTCLILARSDTQAPAANREQARAALRRGLAVLADLREREPLHPVHERWRARFQAQLDALAPAAGTEK